MDTKEQVYTDNLKGLALLMDKLPLGVVTTFTTLINTSNRHDNKRLLQNISDEEKVYFIKASVYLSVMTQVTLPSTLELTFSNDELQRFLNKVFTQLADGNMTQKEAVSAAVDFAIGTYDKNELIAHAERAFFLLNNPLFISPTITSNLYILIFIEMLIYANDC